MKFLRHYNGLLVFLSIVFAVLGFVNLQKNKTEAADQSYTENYEVTKWRNAKLSGIIDSISIGPAEWLVQGENDSMSFSEKWTVTSWADNPGVFKVSSSYNGVATFSTSDTKAASCARIGDHFFTCGSGTYGGSYWSPDGYTSLGSYEFLSSFSSTPEKWKIEGTMSTK